MSPIRILAVFVISLAPFCAAASSPVWKISRGERTVYVGGTCHVLRASDFPLPAAFDRAFAAADEVHFETEIERLGQTETQQIILEKGVHSDGTSLEQAIDAEAWAAVVEYCKRTGIPVEAFAPMKPWFFTVSLTMIELHRLGVTEEGVDLVYHRKATEAGKPTRGLESFEKHLAFITGLGAGNESSMIRNTLESLGELPGVVDRLLAAWRAGDLVGIDAVMLEDMRRDYPSIYRDLLVERNNAWMPAIERMFESEQTELVLVGVAHLAGPDGLIGQLRTLGYDVEPVSGDGRADPDTSIPAEAEQNNAKPAGAGSGSGRESSAKN